MVNSQWWQFWKCVFWDSLYEHERWIGATFWTHFIFDWGTTLLKSGSLEISESVEIYVWSGRDCVRGNLLLQAPNRLPACRRERLKFVWWGKWRLEKDAKGSSEKACFCQDEKMFSYKLADLDLTLTVGLATVYWSDMCIVYKAIQLGFRKQKNLEARQTL